MDALILGQARALQTLAIACDTEDEANARAITSIPARDAAPIAAMSAQDAHVVHLTREGRATIARPLSEEFQLTVVLDGLKVAKLECSPCNCDELAVGYLSTAGLVSKREEILDVRFDSVAQTVHVDTSVGPREPLRDMDNRALEQGFARGVAWLDAQEQVCAAAASDLRVTVPQIVAAVGLLESRSTTHKSTHGTHSAALYGGGRLRIFREDIGRHNAIDKVYGACLLQGIPTVGQILLSSGRVWAETVQKAVRRGTPLVVSIAPPSAQAVAAARQLGITVVMVKGEEVDVYTHASRIVGG